MSLSKEDCFTSSLRVERRVDRFTSCVTSSITSCFANQRRTASRLFLEHSYCIAQYSTQRSNTTTCAGTAPEKSITKTPASSKLFQKLQRASREGLPAFPAHLKSQAGRSNWLPCRDSCLANGQLTMSLENVSYHTPLSMCQNKLLKYLVQMKCHSNLLTAV